MNIQTLLEITEKAKSYKQIACESTKRNRHMNKISPDDEIKQTHAGAILVDFINYLASDMGIDYGMYTSDLHS